MNGAYLFSTFVMDFNRKCALRRRRCLRYWMYLSSMVVARRLRCGAAFERRHRTIGDTFRTDCTSMPRPGAPSSSSVHASDGTRFEPAFLFFPDSWVAQSNGPASRCSAIHIVSSTQNTLCRLALCRRMYAATLSGDTRLSRPFDVSFSTPRISGQYRH